MTAHLLFAFLAAARSLLVHATADIVHQQQQQRQPVAFAVPIITSVSRADFAVEGGGNSSTAMLTGSTTEPAVSPAPLFVTGYGLAATYPGTRNTPACRIMPRAGESAFVHVSGFLEDPRTTILLNATVVHQSATPCVPPCYVAPSNRSCCLATLRCDEPPAVIVPGPGLLSVQNNVGWSTNPVPVKYSFLLDVAVGRRPYIAEARGHLLVRCNASLLGAVVTVTADLPSLAGPASGGRGRWSWNGVTLNGSNVFGFELAGLPAAVNTDLRVVFSSPALPAGAVIKWRRFMKAPPPAAGPAGNGGGGGGGGVESKAAAVPVQVDHHRRGLLVGGQPFVGSGWYLAGQDLSPDWWLQADANLSAPLGVLARQAALGDNQVMPYQLSWLPPAAQLRFLDGCAALGVKVLYPLAPAVGWSIKAAPRWFERMDEAWASAAHVDTATVCSQPWLATAPGTAQLLSISRKVSCSGRSAVSTESHSAERVTAGVAG